MTNDTNEQDQTTPEAITDEDLNQATGGYGGIYLKGKHLPPDLAIADSYEMVAGDYPSGDSSAATKTRSTNQKKT
ncbi:MAG: hypothetical protein AAF479_17335 [Pseudomonadota bacterium]